MLAGSKAAALPRYAAGKGCRRVEVSRVEISAAALFHLSAATEVAGTGHGSGSGFALDELPAFGIP